MQSSVQAVEATYEELGLGTIIWLHGHTTEIDFEGGTRRCSLTDLEFMKVDRSLSMA